MRRLKLEIGGDDVTSYTDKEDFNEVTLQSEDERVWNFWLDSLNIPIYKYCIEKQGLDVNSIYNLKGKDVSVYYSKGSGTNNKIFSGKILKVTKHFNNNKFTLKIESNAYLLAKSYLFKESKESYEFITEWEGESWEEFTVFSTHNSAGGDTAKQILDYMLTELIQGDFKYSETNDWFKKFNVSVEHNADFLAYKNYFLDSILQIQGDWLKEMDDIDHLYLGEQTVFLAGQTGLETNITSPKIIGLYYPHLDKYGLKHNLYLLVDFIEKDWIGPAFVPINLTNNEIEILGNESDIIKLSFDPKLDEGIVFSIDGYDIFMQNYIHPKANNQHLFALIKHHLISNIRDNNGYLFEKELSVSDLEDRQIYRQYSLQKENGDYVLDFSSSESADKNKYIVSSYINDKNSIMVVKVPIQYKDGFYKDGEFIAYSNHSEYEDEAGLNNIEGSMNVNMLASFTEQQNDKLFYEYQGNVQPQQIMKDVAKITNSYVYVKPDNTIVIRDRDGYNANEINIRENKVIEIEEKYRDIDKSFDTPDSFVLEGDFAQALNKRLYDFYSDYLEGEIKDTTLTLLDYNLPQEIYENPILDVLKFSGTPLGTIRKITYRNDNTISVTATCNLDAGWFAPRSVTSLDIEFFG